ncbi:MAG: hypothetical protein RSD04_03695 [Clostridia bacterium]
MRINEIVENALLFLGDGDVKVTKQMEQDEKIKLLSKCANMIVKEIACKFLPLVAKQNVVTKNNAFAYDQLNNRVLEIVKIVELNSGISLDFVQTPDICKVIGAQNIEVTYKYIPRDGAIDGECEISNKVLVKTVALGACAEYCIIQGLYQQSVVFGQKYDEDIEWAKKSNKEIKIKPRRWF